MSARTYHSSHELGDTLVRFPYDEASGVIGLEILPLASAGKLTEPRMSLRGEPFIDAIPGDDPAPARPVESLLQFKVIGDAYPGAFAQGHTLRNSETLHRFKFKSQSREVQGSTVIIRTLLEDACGVTAEQILSHEAGATFMTSESRITNGGKEAIRLELLASFSLSGISPFDKTDSANRLQVHRFRSGWSSEARHECISIEDLHLERSWSGASAFSERFGQLGTMPVRKWFPFVAVEDKVAGVCWGAQLAWAGSWQMEVYRKHDDLCLSGGLADREFGHWIKALAPGESITSPVAYISTVQGSFDELCDRLVTAQEAGIDQGPAVEQDLPVIFNEWCTTWGDPSHRNLLKIADRLSESEVTYLVIDAGWYKEEGNDWSSGHGDWIPSSQLFPDGLKATADAIRERGLIPGLWYEMETVGSQSRAFKAGAHLLMRDGIPITVRERRFWDLNDPGAVDFLTDRVIHLLGDCNFGYLKVDYNETAGLGCDHPDSQGEGLRLQTLGTYRFFQQMRDALPDLVIENCSSGGHRLEPSMFGLTSMSSFSDAHELVEIPIIAANLHRLMTPRQNQIWAVLHPSDSMRRLRYSLAATFLGRMCLSGGVTELSAEQWELTKQAVSFYKACAAVIKTGTSRKIDHVGKSWRHPEGWQALVRSSENQTLIVIHTFSQSPAEILIPLDENPELAGTFTEANYEIHGSSLLLRNPGDFSGHVFLFHRKSS
jgi:alpha-galactosidase